VVLSGMRQWTSNGGWKADHGIACILRVGPCTGMMNSEEPHYWMDTSLPFL